MTEKSFSFELQEGNLTGGEMLDRLRKGHMVRRSCWVDGFFIRITNEFGFDDDGNAIHDEKRDHIYTISTSGYFMHLGYSNQPFRNPYVYKTGYTRYNDVTEEWEAVFEVSARQGEGVAMLWATDWEDYGFIERQDFYDITEILKPIIKKNKDAAVEFAKDSIIISEV